MKKIQIVWAGIAVVVAIIFTLQAQETAIPMRPVFSRTPVSSTADDLAVMLAAVEQTTPTAAEAVPMMGTFQSAQNPLWPPLPGNLHNSPAWNLGDGVWLLDDLDVDYAAAATSLALSRGGMHAMDESGPPSPGDGDGGTNSSGGGGFSPAISFSTNGLWLEIANVDLTDQQADLILHNTAYTNDYQLLSKTNLLQSDWTLGEILTGAGGTNQTVVSGVSLANPMMFFDAHQSGVIVEIDPAQDAVEPEGAIPGRIGIFYVTASGATNDLTVYYRAGGTASNGVDYTNLSGVVTVPLSVGYGEIDVSPIEDDVVEGVETVTLTLMPTNNYLITPDGSGTIKIYDSSTTVSMGTISSQAIESNGPPGAAAQSGSFWLERSDFRGIDTNALDVYYQVSGTASNGVDYAFLNGVVHLPAGVDYTNLDVNPLTEKLITGLETVKVTLTPTNSYLVDTNNQSGTVTILDSSTIVQIIAGAYAEEPYPGGGPPLQTGYFTVNRYDFNSFYTNMTVYYQISGTASNGVDYVTIASNVTFAAGQTSTNIYIQPLADYLTEGNETVILTIQQTNGFGFNGYDLDTNHSAATVTIFDNTNIFAPVASLSGPVGIDYSPVTNALIVSYNEGAGGSPYNFARIYNNVVVSNSIAMTNVVVTNWSGISGLSDEVKLAIVKTNAAGFTNGDIYFGSGTNIGWMSADGSVSNLNWGVLTNATETNTLGLRGSLYVDQTGIFSNQVIAVTSSSDDDASPKGVWRVDAQAHPTLLTNINTFHLEGVITLPNDTNRFGPWAGKIITGDEAKNPPLIYTISTNGSLTSYDTTTLISGGIHTEDFDLIPTNQDLYCCDFGGNTIVKLSRTYFTNYVGDLFITDAGEDVGTGDGSFYIVHWDVASTNFVTLRIPYDSHVEHVTFAPISLPIP